MPAGILQLQAKGIQDVYLTKDPDISFFQYHYFRYVNFANDIYKLHLNQQAAFSTKTEIIIPKKGHLLSKLNLHLRLPKLIKQDGTYICWADTLGYAIFNGPIELLIGGVIVDRIYPVGLDILDELTKSDNGRNRMILKSDNYRSNIYNAEREVNLMIPLDFWFTKNYSSALPLLSMTNQDIQVNFSFADFSNVINYDGNSTPTTVQILESNLYAEYIMLDDIILDQFQKQKHQYIIPQMVYNGDEIISANQSIFSTRINFQNPCKELLFCCVDSDSINNNNHFNYSRFYDESPLISHATLLLDGKHRYDDYMSENIFREFFPNIVHSIVPSKYFYVMPFSIKPEDEQPTGSINLGRFDEALLSLKMTQNNPSCKLYIFGIMYNYLTIENGMASFEWLNV
jgi:hypothetical protein